MAKQYYGCIRLTKHNPGWSDPINDIHLLRTHRTFKCVLEDYDLRPIIKGIKEGLIEFTRADIEGTADADDGARLPMYCGNCICQAYLIKEGVLADYQADVDYQSDLEWQPPQPAEPPAKTPSIQVNIPAKIEAGQAAVFEVKLDQLKPKKVEQGTGEFDENGEEIMEEVEQHQTVTVSVSASGGNISPATLTFSSDPAADNYYANAQQVTFQAPDESANVTIEFSGDGVKPFSKNVQVQGDEPIPEEPEPEVPVVNPVVKINGSSDVIMIERGKDSFEGTITIDYGDCDANALPIDSLSFAMNGQNFDGADVINFTGVPAAPSNDECVVTTITVSMTCGGHGTHTINQTFQVKVPELVAKMFWGPVTNQEVFSGDPLVYIIENYFDDKMTTDAKPIAPYKPNHPQSGGYDGAWYLITPPGINLELIVLDVMMNPSFTVQHTTTVINGIEHKVQYVDTDLSDITVEARQA